MDLPKHVDPDNIAQVYRVTFGAEGEFDSYLFTPEVTERLMREALRRGTPVTAAVVKQVYRAIAGEDPPEYREDAIR